MSIMNCFNDQIKLGILEGKTTYLDDYKKYCGGSSPSKKPTRIRQEPPQKPNPPFLIEDYETFSKYKDNVHIPFDLFSDARSITRTDPRKPFVKLSPLPNDDKIIARQTRPRIYMTPACSIDDVPDEEMRKLLCQYMYTTEWRKAEIEGSKGFEPKKPNIAKIETTDTVTLKTDLYQPLEESFIQRSKQWDDEQRRGSSDPTKDFWVNKDPPVVCGACVNPLDNSVSEESKKEIAEAIRTDRLRLAYDVTSPSYAGFKPRFAYGVSISRKQLPVTHPMLSTSQANTSRFVQDKSID